MAKTQREGYGAILSSRSSAAPGLIWVQRMSMMEPIAAASADLVSPQERYTQERMAHWNALGEKYSNIPFWSRYYHRRVREIYQFLIPPGQRVLELGCGRGDLLAAVRPSWGLGVDFSNVILEQARRSHPQLTFLNAEVHRLPLIKPVDVVIISELVNELWDVEAVFRQVLAVLNPRGRAILNFFSRLWQGPLVLARKLGLARPCLEQSWLTVKDIANLLHLTDFEVIRSWEEVLCPVRVPGLATLCNRFLVKLWPFRAAAMTNFVIARPAPRRTIVPQPIVSIIVPARNEAENIAQIFRRIPRMGRATELIFVEGHSTDDTFERIKKEMAAHPHWHCQLLKQTGKGKGDAVRKGFEVANGEILMILDADLTVAPEDLERFYQALVTGKGDFINGVRLVYPMERKAMRLMNLIGNKFFSVAFSWMLGQPIKDTLCGTKVLWKNDYRLIAANRTYLGDFDPFGDFDLIFGSAKMTLKIVDMPIRYRERVYGTTNIRRWKHGWMLIKMLLFAANRLKCV
jgi:SAM-dependent methyltransferase